MGELKWKALGPPPNTTSGTTWPSPRSGFQLALHGDTLFLYGGYSKASGVIAHRPVVCLWLALVGFVSVMEASVHLWQNGSQRMARWPDAVHAIVDRALPCHRCYHLLYNVRMP